MKSYAPIACCTFLLLLAGCMPGKCGKELEELIFPTRQELPKPYIPGIHKTSLAESMGANPEMAADLESFVDDESDPSCAYNMPAFKRVSRALLPVLRRSLRDSDEGARATAARILGRYYGESAWAPLCMSMNDDSPLVRMEALKGFSRIGLMDAVHVYIGALDDCDAEVRHAAFTALQRCGDGKVRLAFPRALYDESELVRASAFGVLEDIMEQARPFFDSCNQHRWAVRILSKCMRSDDADARMRADSVLSKAAHWSHEAASALVTAVLDRGDAAALPSEICRMRHVITWARRLHLSSNAILTLVKYEASGSFEVRKNAHYLLESCDISSCDNEEEIIRELAKLLAHRDCLVRQSATEVLGKMSGWTPKTDQLIAGRIRKLVESRTLKDMRIARKAAMGIRPWVSNMERRVKAATAHELGELLKEAVIRQDFGEIRELTARGADLNIEMDFLNSTPLHYCLRTYSSELRIHLLLEYLLENRAAIDSQDLLGDTPLHLAVQKKDFDSAETLLRHGANPDMRNAERITPRDLAENSALSSLFGETEK